jgi:hypothetical protein
MKVVPRDNSVNGFNFLIAMPGIFKIYASNDSASWSNNNHSSWTQIHSQTTSLTFNYNQYTDFGNFSGINTAYRYFAMVVYNLTGSYSYLTFSEWDIFGQSPEIKKFPESLSTNSNTWVDGGYTVVCKSSDSILNASYDIYQMFNNSIFSETYYHGGANIYNASSPFNYTGSTSFKGSNGIVIYIDLGRSIYLRNMRIAPRDNTSYPTLDFIGGAPGKFKIYASNDSACWNDNNHFSWTEIHSQTTSLTLNYNQYTAFGSFSTINTPYRYFAMVTYNLIGTYGFLMISEWEIIGTFYIAPVILDNDYKYITFTHSGSSEPQTSYTVNFPESKICDILIVGGGGAGDRDVGGGGGGGAVLYATGITVPANSYIIKVGKGGVQSVNGSPSEAFGATCLGGGSTTFVAWNTANVGSDGGSGSGSSAGGTDIANGGGVGVSNKGTFLDLNKTTNGTVTLYNGMPGGWLWWSRTTTKTTSMFGWWWRGWDVRNLLSKYNRNSK